MYFPSKFTHKANLHNQKGQGMIEYIILVALMAIGTIGMVRVLSEGINVKFSSITAALQGESPVRRRVDIPENWQKRRTLKDFLNGTTSSSRKQSNSRKHKKSRL